MPLPMRCLATCMSMFPTKLQSQGKASLQDRYPSNIQHSTYKLHVHRLQCLLHMARQLASMQIAVWSKLNDLSSESSVSRGSRETVTLIMFVRIGDSGNFIMQTVLP